MVTCSLNGGSNDTAQSGSQARSSAHHQAGVLCIADQDEKFPSPTSASNGHATTPMDIAPAIHPIKDVKLGHHDHPDTVSVTLYIKKIEENSLQVEFLEKSISVIFRSRDPGFLQRYPSFDPEEDLFRWKIDTRGPIEPSRCSYKLKPTNLELKLIKAVIGSWESLEVPDSTSTSRGIQSEKWISLAPKTAAIANPTDDIEAEEPTRAGSVNRTGYTGLGNLGNTCYMNAVLQCLANCTPLKNYFLDKKFQTEINRENPLGFGGSLAVSFAVILRQLWSGQRDSIEPSNLKTLLSNKASQFSGYAQHDAQEFMAFLLDGLHEDLNRVKCKPLTSAVESDGRPDPVVADEAWQVYKKRNDSVIVDLFQGQYKSTLICPCCHKVSVTFDPFLYLALPLPPSKSCFTVTLFSYCDGSTPLAPSESAVKVTLWLDLGQRVEHLKLELKRQCADRLLSPDSEIELVQTRDGLIRRRLTDPAPLNSLHNCPEGTSLLAFETPPCMDEDSSLVHIAVIQRVLIPPEEQTRCASCKKENVGLKRCLKCYRVAYCDRDCQKNHWTLVHRTVCKYKPTIVGQPFIISLPPSALTYKRVHQAMFHYARFSVDVSAGPTCRNGNQDIELSSPSSSSSSSPSSSASASSSFSSSPGISATEEGDAQQPWFVIKPIDSQGQSINKERLEDRGEELLDLRPDGDESPIFLAMDWRNNDRVANYCVVSNKPSDADEIPVLDTGADQQNPHRLTLHHCLEQFMRPEVLSREEAWYCPKCKEHREATKQMSLWRLPEILTIQLKRFSFRNLLWRDKIDQMVHFPIRQLDLAPYLSVGASSDGAVYDLFAVVNHYGGILYGHYTAFARCPPVKDMEQDVVGWRCMDDRQVRDVSAESVVTPAAYLLLYRRRHSPLQGLPPPPARANARPPPAASPRHVNYSDPEEID